MTAKPAHDQDRDIPERFVDAASLDLKLYKIKTHKIPRPVSEQAAAPAPATHQFALNK
jgi:hypothetical protein